MTLKDWLAKNKMTDAEFARVSGIGQRALVHKYRHGRQFPAPENLRRIRTATKGAVTANDFLDQNATDSPPAPDLATPIASAPKRRTPASPKGHPKASAEDSEPQPQDQAA
jgi:transcriptional regulator with XRE-family HTH domain